MIRRFLVPCLAAAVCAAAIAAGAPALAEDVVPPNPAAPLTVPLTLEQATLRALEGSPELELARLAVEEAEIALIEAEVGQLEGQPRHVLDQARQDVEAARASFVQAVQQVAAEVEESYYDILRQQESLAIQQQNLDRAERQWRLAQARFEAGLISRHEMDEAHDAYLRSQEQLEASTFSLELALAAFRELLAVPGTAPLDLVETVTYQPLRIDPGAAAAHAMQARREVRDAARAVRSAEEQVKAADDPHTPPVELTRARLALDRARLQLELQQAAIREDVRQHALALWSAQQKVEAAQRARDLAASRLAIAQARYDAGRISLLELLKAQADDASARLDAVGAVWEHEAARARWLRATGDAPLPTIPEAVATLLKRWDAGAAARHAPGPGEARTEQDGPNQP